ncbi:hypothetical protein [Lutzomyia reovirus 1]|uniref:hypothetical protein n=1 Tax=Lutzomyia reovirus 1 TaxID=1670669 RepID=UPI00065EEC5B|nr:hypothetical protein [Lutzomyia reovirus 1]AKP18610.1 hypothetical protein [Lutzomyia reovirus 1]AKP18611.1 hypothetical protein [Lutzomyia reovirus 1]
MEQTIYTPGTTFTRQFKSLIDTIHVVNTSEDCRFAIPSTQEATSPQIPANHAVNRYQDDYTESSTTKQTMQYDEHASRSEARFITTHLEYERFSIILTEQKPLRLFGPHPPTTTMCDRTSPDIVKDETTNIPLLQYLGVTPHPATSNHPVNYDETDILSLLHVSQLNIVVIDLRSMVVTYHRAFSHNHAIGIVYSNVPYIGWQRNIGHEYYIRRVFLSDALIGFILPGSGIQMSYLTYPIQATPVPYYIMIKDYSNHIIRMVMTAKLLSTYSGIIPTNTKPLPPPLSYPTPETPYDSLLRIQQQHNNNIRCFNHLRKQDYTFLRLPFHGRDQIARDPRAKSRINMSEHWHVHELDQGITVENNYHEIVNTYEYAQLYYGRIHRIFSPHITYGRLFEVVRLHKKHHNITIAGLCFILHVSDDCKSIYGLHQSFIYQYDIPQPILPYCYYTYSDEKRFIPKFYPHTNSIYYQAQVEMYISPNNYLTDIMQQFEKLHESHIMPIIYITDFELPVTSQLLRLHALWPRIHTARSRYDCTHKRYPLRRNKDLLISYTIQCQDKGFSYCTDTHDQTQYPCGMYSSDCSPYAHHHRCTIQHFGIKFLSPYFGYTCHNCDMTYPLLCMKVHCCQV